MRVDVRACVRMCERLVGVTAACGRRVCERRVCERRVHVSGYVAMCM